MVLNPGPLDRDFSALTNRPLVDLGLEISSEVSNLNDVVLKIY